MHGIKLSLVACAAAAAACLAVVYALREPRAPGRALAPAAGQAAQSEPVAPARSPAPALAAELDVSGIARAARAQEEALRDSIWQIGEDQTLSLDARLDRYREALAGHRDLMSPSMQAELFLRMGGVQRELAALSPSARSGQIAHIRRELGFDDEAIARMEQIDDRREARWQTGLAYMQERARIVDTFEGDALESELDALRAEYFAHEAPTIEAEERDGFFRFERPRIYGRN